MKEPVPQAGASQAGASHAGVSQAAAFRPAASRAAPPRLGRGLAALFGDIPPEAAAGAPRAMLSVGVLDPGPFQPRTAMDPGRLQELTESIRHQGVLQPILVRPHPDQPGRYQIIAGERRWRAAQAAGLQDIPVLVRTLSDIDAMAASVVENLQRQDLDPIEEAEAYKRLIAEFGMTQDGLGGLIGKSRSHVANTMRLLNLPAPLRTHLREGTLTPGHARALLSHPAPETAARAVIAQGLNVRQTEAMVQRVAQPAAPRAAPRAAPDAEMAALGRDLSARLGLQVQVAFDGQTGSVRLHLQTLDQLEGVVALLTRE